MTRPLISFVIPALNEEDIIEDTLRRLQPWRPLAEVILVDGGSEDNTVSLAQPWCDRVLSSEAGRARQMNCGAGQAGGRYLFFLHCDTRLNISPRELRQILEERPRWGFFMVRLSGGALALRVIELFMNLRSGLSRIATGDQLLFVHAELFSRLDGFAVMPLMEDVELCTRMRRLHAPRRIMRPVITSSRRWEERGILRTVLTMWRLRLSYWLGTPPERLARIYYG